MQYTIHGNIDSIYIYIYLQQRRHSRDTNRNIKRSVYCMPIRIVYYLTFRALSLRQREKPDEGPMTETLDYTIRIGSTPTFIHTHTHTHIYIYIYIYIYINPALNLAVVYFE